MVVAPGYTVLPGAITSVKESSFSLFGAWKPGIALLHTATSRWLLRTATVYSINAPIPPPNLINGLIFF
ncbi:MAG: hypothetical protein RBS37_05695 [Bacteroidales bacterium]|jgi:hypothetical protein|nr:hypothetical protein [Bacteroidales bacterium]